MKNYYYNESRFDFFACEFENLELSEKVAVYNKFKEENNDSDSEFHEFSEDVFNLFPSPMAAAKAVSFGRVRWADEWLKFNGYGHLVSFSNAQVLKEIESELEAIYECAESYADYIGMEEFEEIEVCA